MFTEKMYLTKIGVIVIDTKFYTCKLSYTISYFVLLYDTFLSTPYHRCVSSYHCSEKNSYYK